MAGRGGGGKTASSLVFHKPNLIWAPWFPNSFMEPDKVTQFQMVSESIENVGERH